MINWLKNKLFKEAASNHVEETPDEAGENFAPVGVRLNPPVAVRVKPADTYIAGYNVDEAEFGADDSHSNDGERYENDRSGPLQYGPYRSIAG